MFRSFSMMNLSSDSLATPMLKLSAASVRTSTVQSTHERQDIRVHGTIFISSVPRSFQYPELDSKDGRCDKSTRVHIANHATALLITCLFLSRAKGKSSALCSNAHCGHFPDTDRYVTNLRGAVSAYENLSGPHHIRSQDKNMPQLLLWGQHPCQRLTWTYHAC